MRPEFIDSGTNTGPVRRQVERPERADLAPPGDAGVGVDPDAGAPTPEGDDRRGHHPDGDDADDGRGAPHPPPGPQPARTDGNAPTVEKQLKAKFAEVVVRKEAPPPQAPAGDTKDRIASIFRKVQSESTKRTAPEMRPQATSDATDRIASIMRKGLGQSGPAASRTARITSR